MNEENKKPSAHELWLKANKEGLDFRQLLIDNGALVCVQCMGTGYYSIGGSFEGSVQTMKCDCRISVEDSK